MCARPNGIGHPRRRVLEVVLAILLAGIATRSHAQQLTSDGQPMLVVRIDNVVAAPGDNVLYAEERTAEVFARIGAGVRWIDEDTASREHLRPPFTMVLVNAERNKNQMVARVQEALGMAEPSVRRAHVFLDRIEELSARSRRDPASLLGDVMAHELGHLLLSS